MARSWHARMLAGIFRRRPAVGQEARAGPTAPMVEGESPLDVPREFRPWMAGRDGYCRTIQDYRTDLRCPLV